jgi:hypothetical protein
MALYRIDTSFFDVVNLSDPDVREVAGNGDGVDDRPNRWVSRGAVAEVGSGATVVRIRALTRPEIDAAPMDQNTAFLAAMVDAGVHPDDKAAAALLPWQFQRSLGSLVFEVSTVPLDSAKGR